MDSAVLQIESPTRARCGNQQKQDDGGAYGHEIPLCHSEGKNLLSPPVRGETVRSELGQRLDTQTRCMTMNPKN